MAGGSVTAPLAAARAELQRACGLLVASTPEAWNGCRVALEEAVAQLARFRSQPRGPESDAAVRMAGALRKEVLLARALLQNLAAFYRGWERILGTMSGGYTSSGEPAPVSRTGRLCCRG
jgi:hypothetical protein